MERMQGERSMILNRTFRADQESRGRLEVESCNIIEWVDEPNANVPAAAAKQWNRWLSRLSTVLSTTE